jgi:Zn-dependent protease
MGGFHLFTLADIPVSISPWYLLLMLYLVQGGIGVSPPLAVLAVTLSLLVHELGHALVARHYQLRPHILLHGFGGLTGHERPRSGGQDALIVAAGPLAGLLLGAFCWVLPSVIPPRSQQGLDLLVLMTAINVQWSLFNLLPIWPMDGGQLLRLGASKLWKPARGERVTHILSLVVVITITSLTFFTSLLPSGNLVLMILALTAWQNIQKLSEGRASAPRDNPRARELWTQAEAAYQAGRDDDAVRLCHLLRHESHVPAPVMARAWAILGVSATKKDQYEEALSYLRRAPDLPEVVESTAQCFYQLGMLDALEALVGTSAFARLPSDTRDNIERALRDGPRVGPG